MMQRLLFSHSYFLRFDPKQWATAMPYAPLGTLYAMGLMRAHGYEVSLFDTMFEAGPEKLRKVLEEAQPGIFVLYDDGFNYLTKMCLTNMRAAAFEMIAMAKASGCTVIVSSSDSTDWYEMYLNAGADFIIIGEGEMALLELVKEIEKPAPDFLPVQGLAFTYNAAILKTAKRPVMTDLDALPAPAWDLINMKPYREMWVKNHGYFSINMGTTRGCPFKCNWCAKPIYGNRYNARSPQAVVDEIKYLQEILRFSHIWFCDDIFGMKPGWIKTFAAAVNKSGIKLSFKMQGRADLLLLEDNIIDLAKAGCKNIWMGAESGSQKILDAMDKGTTVNQIYAATRLLKKHGINPSFFIQFGYPGETKEDICRTINMINELLPYEIGISVSYPLPGTAFFEKVKQQLTEKTNWTDSDELALLFRNTYQPAYYKELHRYVHKTYRAHLALKNMRQLLSFKVGKTAVKKAASFIYYFPASYISRLKLWRLEKA